MASSKRNSYASNTSSPVNTINSIMQRQPPMVDMEEEKKTFASGEDGVLLKRSNDEGNGTNRESGGPTRDDVGLMGFG
ncbi:hypothetical protein LOCC1_G000064 [Lachnellula occidentalis]|uniref:Uncharacterized protein n=1 Tax=Lachnellula occidentalis TaxID=215460 RepID=A0A8H8S8H9_9HELO|nr:hypothetical protein LOCC1_G000064 [Lachnellula occidentalis]